MIIKIRNYINKLKNIKIIINIERELYIICYENN